MTKRRVATILLGLGAAGCQVERTPSCDSASAAEVTADLTEVGVDGGEAVLRGTASVVDPSAEAGDVERVILGMRVDGVEAEALSAGFREWTAKIPLSQVRRDRRVGIEIEHPCQLEDPIFKTLDLELPAGTRPEGVLQLEPADEACFVPVIGGQPIELAVTSSDQADAGLMIMLDVGAELTVFPAAIRLDGDDETASTFLSIGDPSKAPPFAAVFASAGGVLASPAPLSIPVEAAPQIEAGETSLAKSAWRELEVRSRGKKLTCSLLASDDERSTVEVLTDGGWVQASREPRFTTTERCGISERLRVRFDIEATVGDQVRLRCEDDFGQSAEATWVAATKTAGDIEGLGLSFDGPGGDCYFPGDGSAWGAVTVTASVSAAGLSVELRPTGVELTTGGDSAEVELEPGAGEAFARAAIRVARGDGDTASIVTVLAGASSDTVRLPVAGPPSFTTPARALLIGSELPVLVRTEGRLAECSVQSPTTSRIEVFRGSQRVGDRVEFGPAPGCGQSETFLVRALLEAISGEAVVLSCEDVFGQRASTTLTAAAPDGG